MPQYEVELIFSTGDDQTAAKFAVQREAAGPAAAISELLDTFDTGNGFTSDDLVQVLVTKQDHGVATNLLY